MNATNSSTHSLGGTTEHIYIRVINGLVPHRGNSVEVNLLGAFALGLVSLSDVSPQEASSAEFCNLHKVVRGDRSGEADALCSIGCAHAPCDKFHEHLVTCRHHITKFLNDGRTAVADERAINACETNVFELFVVLDVASDFVEALLATLLATAEFTIASESPHNGIEIESNANSLFVELCCPLHNRLHDGGVGGADVEYDLVLGGVDAGGQSLNKRLVHLFANLESNALCATVECVECFFVSLCGALYIDSLKNFPPVAVLHTANIGELASRSTKELNCCQILCTVVRADIKALGCAPNQFFLVVGTFEVGHNDTLPLLCRDCGKLVEQPFVLVVCHNFF